MSSTQNNKFAAIIKEMRVHHYIKNLLIFLPLFCSGQMMKNSEALKSAAIGFLSFCFLSSAIYIINDVKDYELDIRHPQKSKRPIASGVISKRESILICILLIVMATVLNLALLDAGCLGMLWAGIYFAINLGYSFGLKKVPIIDIALLALGFVIRVRYGASITSIPLSNWLYFTVLSAALYLAIGKRQGEFRRVVNDKIENTRDVLKGYSSEFLTNAKWMFLALTIMFYALWSVSEPIIEHYSNYFMWTTPIVILVFLRYELSASKSWDGDPVEVVLHDYYLLGGILAYGIAVAGLLYIL